MLYKQTKHNNGKFFLVISSRFGPSYYKGSGIFDVVTSRPEPFLYWTRYRDYAYGFKTVKSARAMANKLWEEHGIRVRIVNWEGAVI